MNKTYDYETEAIDKLLIGHAITDVDEQSDELILDDGTRLRIIANQGCGGCSSGNFWVDNLTAFPNVITRVEYGDETRGGDEVLSIFVYAEGTSAEVVTVAGDTGNGYYGRGFMVEVVA